MILTGLEQPFSYAPPCSPEQVASWQAELDRAVPPTDHVSHLRIVWEPGDPWGRAMHAVHARSPGNPTRAELIRALAWQVERNKWAERETDIVRAAGAKALRSLRALENTVCLPEQTGRIGTLAGGMPVREISTVKIDAILRENHALKIRVLELEEKLCLP